MQRRKSRTIVGTRIPKELMDKARYIQHKCAMIGRKVSLQDIYREMARSIE